MTLVRVNGKLPPGEPMVYYASSTRGVRTLNGLRASGMRILISRAGEWRHEGFPYCLDNGAWPDFIRNRPFDEDAFERMIELLGPGSDFIILPDIVAGGLQSLELSMRWMNRCRSLSDLVLIAVQDGMTPEDLRPYVGPNVGIFLGGSTEWKLATMREWGQFCVDMSCWYHVARVNTARRFRMAHAAGGDSADGSSATKFSVTIPLLDGARRQPDLYPPLKEEA